MSTGPVLVTSAVAGSPEWHAARRDTINGSEIAAILGISPYESAFALWHRKAGRLPEVEQTGEMYWGLLLEDVIREEWNRRHRDDGVVAVRTGLWRHRERPWQGGNPDGLVWPTRADVDRCDPPVALLEVKTARHPQGWGEPGTDEIPVHYRAQALWYLDVFGVQVCHVAVLIAGSDYHEYRVVADAAEAEFMRGRAAAFLDTLARDEAPPLDGHDATYQAVRELHPDIDPVTVELDRHVALGYLDALVAAKAAETEKRHRAARVIEAMGAAQHASWLGERIASRVAPKTEGQPPFLRAENGAADLHREATPPPTYIERPRHDQ